MFFVAIAIMIIASCNEKKKFDVLLVFMFDRIGRIADETPFVAEWFSRNGIEGWSFKEGFAPYGYDLVKSGRLNKRKHEVFMLAVNEEEAAVVRIIYDKYVYEGFGPQRIATHLNSLGYRARSGKPWHHASSCSKP